MLVVLVSLFGLFGESETGDGRGGGVYHAKVFKTKNIGGYSL